MKVDILFFGPDPDASWRAQQPRFVTQILVPDKARWQLEGPRLAKLPGVSVRDITDPEGLIQSLRDSLAIDKFYVVPVGQSKPPAAMHQYLGRTWAVDPSPAASQDYDIVVVDSLQKPLAQTRVRLDGGEAIQLMYNRTRQRLINSRLESRYARQWNIPAHENLADQYYVAPEAPTRGGNRITFRVSVQQQDAELVCPRPSFIWAELRPLPSREPVYYFQDASYEPGQPVPVLEFEVPEFPADKAELKLWFTNQPAENVYSQEVGRAGTNQPWNLKFKKNATSTQFTIIEEHEPSSGEFPLRISLQPPADRILRQYNPKDERTVYRFEYERPLTGPAGYLVGPHYSPEWIAVPPIEFPALP